MSGKPCKAGRADTPASHLSVSTASSRLPYLTPSFGMLCLNLRDAACCRAAALWPLKDGVLEL